MSRISEIRKTVSDTVTDQKPVFAAVGVTDLAVEKAREARARAAKARADLDQARADLHFATVQSKLQGAAKERAAKLQAAANEFQATATARATKAGEQAQDFPGLVVHRGLEFAGKAEESYKGFASRGEKLVKRIRTQKATQDLMAQAQNTVALGKGAVTTVRKAAAEFERTAKATLTTGRHQTTKAVDTIAESVADEAKFARSEITEAAVHTRTSAKRTATTARKGTARSVSSAKGVATSAEKTVQASAKAAKTASKKVGD